METVGRYEILGEVGSGGMATVYLARQADLGRDVALKELGVLRASDVSLARRFLREARMAGSLSHPNIVTVHDYFEEGGTPFIAMEYVPGGSLRAHVPARRSLAQVGGVLEGLLAGLMQAEEHGIVHRDLKPENVLVTADGHVKIADFGIAKAGDQVLTATSLTAVGTTMGTPAYMAPEQALGEQVGPATDLYAVGVMTFELLKGQAPFADTDSPMAVLLRQVNDTIPPVHEIRPDVDPRISDWIERLLVKDPAGRTASAAVAWNELEDLLLELLGPRWRRDARLPLEGRPPVTSGPALRTPPTRRLTATAPWVDAESTLPPRATTGATAVAAPEPEAASRARPRRWPWAFGLFAMIAVAAALAAAGRGAGGGAPTRGASTGGANTAGASAGSAGGVPAGQVESTAPSSTSGSAPSPSLATQATGARAQADRYDQAAQRLAANGGDPAAVAGLRQAAAGYRTAADAATANDAQGYAQAIAGAQAAARSATSTPRANATKPAATTPAPAPAGGGENADDGGDDGGTAGGGGGENADDGGDGP